MNHAILAPSSAPHWRWCAGSVALVLGMEQEETDASRDGTAAHWIGEQILLSFIDPDRSVVISDDFIDEQAPNGVIMTEEMYDAAYTYAIDILNTVQKSGIPMRSLHIEETVTMPEIHEQCWGTPDCWAFDEKTHTLHLWDFKFGHGSVVAYENWQMICYALGVLNVVTNGRGLNQLDIDITVSIRISQPRCYDGLGPFRDWEIKATDLRGYVNQLAMAAEQAIAMTGQCNTGPWCKNCDGAALCPALRDAVAGVIDRSTDIIPSIPTDDGLAYEMDLVDRAAALLKQRKDALYEMAEHRMRKGGTVPGRALEQGYGKSNWLQPDADVIAMGELMGVDLRAEPKLLTPAKAREKLKKNNVDAGVIKSYYGSKPTAMKVVVNDGSKAEQIFSRRSI